MFVKSVFFRKIKVIYFCTNVWVWWFNSQFIKIQSVFCFNRIFGSSTKLSAEYSVFGDLTKTHFGASLVYKMNHLQETNVARDSGSWYISISCIIVFLLSGLRFSWKYFTMNPYLKDTGGGVEIRLGKQPGVARLVLPRSSSDVQFGSGQRSRSHHWAPFDRQSYRGVWWDGRDGGRDDGGWRGRRRGGKLWFRSADLGIVMFSVCFYVNACFRPDYRTVSVPLKLPKSLWIFHLWFGGEIVFEYFSQK